jgi:hypothetical protein
MLAWNPAMLLTMLRGMLPTTPSGEGVRPRVAAHRTWPPVLAQYLAVQDGVTIGAFVDRFELAINRIRRLFITAFATAAAIGGLVGSPAALADPEPPPPPPAPGEPAHADVPEMPREQCMYINIFMPCEEELLPPLPDTPGTPDRP